MRQIKDSRVKSFNTFDEAMQFVKYGIEKPLVEACKYATQIQLVYKVLVIIDTIYTAPGNAVQTPEKSLYRGPKSQDLVLFRKLIEQDKVDLVVDTIWKNPRYLIGAGDTPTILKVSKMIKHFFYEVPYIIFNEQQKYVYVLTLT